MAEVKLGYYIRNFVYLNPKNNKYPNFNKYDLNSFLIIKNQFKENKKYIITSNYDDIFYNKNEFLNGKRWIEISAKFVIKCQLNKSNDALSLATYGKLNLIKLISFDNNINQKLDMILQILNEQKNSSNKSDENNWKD